MKYLLIVCLFLLTGCQQQMKIADITAFVRETNQLPDYWAQQV